MGQWLGTGRIADQYKEYLPFYEAREFSRSLKLKSLDDWLSFCKSQEKPLNIPSYPSQTYKNKGWKGIGDWLGYESHLDKHFLNYNDAKLKVKQLGIRSMNEYRKFYKDNKEKIFLPASPSKYYKGKGWVSFGDFFSTDRIAHYKKKYMPFRDARAYARKLNLASSQEWRDYFKNNKPNDISLSPHNTYKNKGWKSWGDWLGTNRVADGKQEWISYEKARAYAIRNGITSKSDWNTFKKNKNLPYNIPKNPYGVYKRKNEWKGWAHFFGKEE